MERTFFSFLDFSKNTRVLLHPVGKLYVVAALLVNFHTCLYGSQTTQCFFFFYVEAPELRGNLFKQFLVEFSKPLIPRSAFPL